MTTKKLQQFNKKVQKEKPDKVEYLYSTKKGINEKVIKEISYMKGEPVWMKDIRLRAYKMFKKKKNPKWGVDLSKLDLNDLYFYIKPTEKVSRKWS